MGNGPFFGVRIFAGLALIFGVLGGRGYDVQEHATAVVGGIGGVEIGVGGTEVAKAGGL